MDQKLLGKCVSIAIEAAHLAGDVLKHHFTKKLRIEEKPGAGLVTEADRLAEKKALSIFRKTPVSYSVLAEESGSTGHGELKWIIDPLDGTTNYIHGFPMFCVSIAASWKGKLVLGVIYHPIFKDTYLAKLNKGATLNGKPIHVSKTKDVKNSLLTTGFTYRKESHLKDEMVAFENLSKKARAIRRPGSAALDLAYTARGVFDGFWESRLQPWDIAAGALLVKEANGQISDFDGSDYESHNREIVATNGRIHRQILKEIIKS